MHYAVLWASQTGTATGYAEKLVRVLLRCGLDDVRMYDDIQRIPFDTPTLLLVVISTTGLGQVPRSFASSWAFLRQRCLDRLSGSAIKFAVLGLGDRTYGINFNRAARLVDARLEQLGCLRILPVALGDAQAANSHDTEFAAWVERLKEAFGVHQTLTHLPPRVCLRKGKSRGGCGSKNGTVESVHRMTPRDHFQNVFTVRFDLEQPRPDALPGDVAIVKPWNSEESVREAVDLLSRIVTDWPASLDDLYALVPNRADCAALEHPPALSLLSVLTTLLDLSAPPNPYLFEFLSNRVECDDDPGLYREKLLDLASDTDDAYFEYVARPRRSTLECLADFQASIRLHLDDLFDVFPRINPRSFSVANYSPSSIELCVAFVQYRTPQLARGRRGLCSQYLHSLRPGQGLDISFTRGTFAIPPSQYFILMGAGTGIAPIRAFLQYFSQKDPPTIPRCWLFHGCRNASKDSLYREEFERMPLHGYILAGSRDQPRKRYLQHLIAENAKGLKEWIVEKQAVLLFSGNSKLPTAIRAALSEHLSLPEDFIRHLERTGRLQHETW